MTQISDIIDQWSTLIEGQISGITEIPNPYEPQKNPDLYLQNGYGVGFGPAENTNRSVGGHASIERDFDIMLFRQIAATENDTDGVKTVAKAMLEDQLKIIKVVEKDPSLAKTCVKCVFATSDPVEYLIDNETGRRYFSLIASFRCEYFEALGS